MRLLGIVRCTATLALASVGLVAACGTDAEGVSQCRTIEAARCRAAASCGLVEDVELCLRYTRDHCLHGTATGGTPRPAEVRDCVAVLEQAGSCAADATAHRRPTPTLEACDNIDLAPGGDAQDVCELILEPEQALECSFLMPLEVEEEEPTPAQEDAGSDGS